MKIAGFLKVRNEIVREGNLYRALRNLSAVCDGGVLCDDASWDGTAEVLADFCRDHAGWVLLRVKPSEQSFGNELVVKQRMMDAIHAMPEKPTWVWWLDADETVDRPEEFKRFIQACGPYAEAYRFHYTQLWRTSAWARTDDGFDEGSFVKLWRYRADLSFNTRPGTHHQQFPQQINLNPACCPTAPFEVVHWGNYGKCLTWKGIQYSGGLGGVDRHLHFGHSPATSLSTGVGYDKQYPAERPTYREVPRALIESAGEPYTMTPMPEPFTIDDIKTIRSLEGMSHLDDTFCVIVPAFNRAKTLPKALDSLIAQTHKKWVAFVLDDGSTDDTAGVLRRYQDADPRIFYARYPNNRGGVAMNELGMNIAIETAAYWTRLGSDDWFGPRKLELDAQALKRFGACYGCFTVQRSDAQGTRLEETCCPAVPKETIRAALAGGQFVASWANIAVRSSVLRAVRERFGGFVDARLRNMEDFLANARIAAFTDIPWRGMVNGRFCTEGDADFRPGLKSEELEGIWNDCQTGASGNQAQSAKDDILTRQLIAEMRPIFSEELWKQDYR